MEFTQKINFQRLLDEKNQELETLRQQYHSTPQPQSWSSRLTFMFYSQLILDHSPCLIQSHLTPNILLRLEDSKASSVEQLREASMIHGGFKDQRLMLDSKLQSGNRKEPARSLILEEDMQNSQYLERDENVDNEQTTASKSHLVGQTIPCTEIALEEKVAQIELMTKILNDKEDQLDILGDSLKDKENQLATANLRLSDKEEELIRLTRELKEKELELGSVADVMRGKEELLVNLQKNNSELTSMIEDLRTEAEVTGTKSQHEESKLRKEIELAKVQAVDLENKLNSAVIERGKIELELQDARDQCVILSNQLQEVKAKLLEVEARSLEEAETEVVEEVKRAREEREDLVRGMENLHTIIESGQRQLEEERQGSEALRNDMLAMERQLASSTKSMEKLALALGERQEKVEELEAMLEQTGRSLRSKEDEVSSLLQTQLLAQGSSHTTELLQEKHELERQLEKITKDMAGVEKVVTEMSKSFKHQMQVKEGEARAERERAETLSQMNAELEQRCSQLEAAQDTETQRNMSNMGLEGGRLSGSVEDLSRQLQHELDLSSELDNSLLSQVAAMDTSSSSGLSEVQRLLKKIQNDGIKVLSLSERLFLMKHSNLGSDMASGEGDCGEKERELDRRLGMMESQLEQERTLTRDLRDGLEAEKKLGLDSMARLSAERQERQELEHRLEEMARELREHQRHIASDSDNAEFLDTIEAQKLQVLSLEESLQQERQTLGQLQQLLEVERSRGRRDPDSSTGGRLEEVTAKLRQDLNKERGVRKRLEDSVSLDEVGQLVVRQLHLDLQHERTQVCDLILARGRFNFQTGLKSCDWGFIAKQV